MILQAILTTLSTAEERLSLANFIFDCNELKLTFKLFLESIIPSEDHVFEVDSALPIN